MSWYLNKIKPHSRVFSLMPRTASEYLSEHGIDIVPMDIDFNTADARDFTKFMLRSEPSKVEAVVVDLNVNTGFAHLIKALQYLKDPECQLILGAMDAFIPLTQQFIIPGKIKNIHTYLRHESCPVLKIYPL